MIRPIYIAALILFSGASSYGQMAAQRPAKVAESAQHAIIYHQEGRFASWPANNGAWIFNGKEILTGFTEAEYKLGSGHNATEPYNSWLARSKDGGYTWKAVDPVKYVGDFGKIPGTKPLEKPIRFDHPKFALRVSSNGYHGNDDPNGHFFYSYNAGVTWNGPFGFGNLAEHPELKKYNLTDLTPRTDYIVMGKNECLLFFSAREQGVFGSDRLFSVKTADGGLSFDFHGWIVKPHDKADTEGVPVVAIFNDLEKDPYATECRAVMSQSSKLKDGTLISVMRRKYETGGATFNWLDAYTSSDGGATWTLRSYVASTGAGNGNPPGMTLLADGRICVVYGERTYGTIQAVMSSDHGRTWSEPVLLMEGFWSEDMEFDDLGYPRVVQRKDGKVVAIYYYSTKEHLHHLRATVWEP